MDELSMLPPASPDEMPAQPKTVTLTPDLKDAFGLANCKPGDTYTITIQTKDASEGDTQTFDVLSSVPDDAKNPGDEDGGPGSEDQGGPGDDMSPSADEAQPPAVETNGEAPPADDLESKLLGVPRKKKPVREGIPSTKNLREHL